MLTIIDTDDLAIAQTRAVLQAAIDPALYPDKALSLIVSQTGLCEPGNAIRLAGWLSDLLNSLSPLVGGQVLDIMSHDCRSMQTYMDRKCQLRTTQEAAYNASADSRVDVPPSGGQASGA